MWKIEDMIKLFKNKFKKKTWINTDKTPNLEKKWMLFITYKSIELSINSVNHYYRAICQW